MWLRRSDRRKNAQEGQLRDLGLLSHIQQKAAETFVVPKNYPIFVRQQAPSTVPPTAPPPKPWSPQRTAYGGGTFHQRTITAGTRVEDERAPPLPVVLHHTRPTAQQPINVSGRSLNSVLAPLGPPRQPSPPTNDDEATPPQQHKSENRKAAANAAARQQHPKEAVDRQQRRPRRRKKEKDNAGNDPDMYVSFSGDVVQPGRSSTASGAVALPSLPIGAPSSPALGSSHKGVAASKDAAALPRLLPADDHGITGW